MQPGTNIAIRTVPNLRDLGGWTTSFGGTVRRGLLFRSAEFSDLVGPDLASFAALGIRTVFDFRTVAEREAQPNLVPAGTRYVVLDILRDLTGAAPAMLNELVEDPQLAEQMLGGGKAEALFQHAYRSIVSLPSALEGYRAFYTDLTDSSSRPAVFHCTTGKDRTGWAAASFLLLMGVSEADVRTDYLLTNAQLLPALQPIFDAFAGKGGDPDLLTPVLGVRPSYLQTALDEMHKLFGSIEAYFTDGLGLSADQLELLRSTFVEPGPAATGSPRSS